MKIIAHRGYSKMYPENSMQAFINANKPYVYGIELDVHLTKDNIAVIIHDETLDRTTKLKGLVKEHTFEMLKGVIPSLEEYLEFVKDTHLFTNIELKTNIYEYRGIEKIVVDLIDKHHLKDRIVISSSNHNTLKRIKKISDIKIGVLLNDVLLNPVQYAKILNPFSINPEYHMVDKDFFNECEKENIKIICYTVDDKKDFERLRKIGIEYIITNDIKI